MKLAKLCDYLERFAPLRLAEEWDNVGLLVGDSQRSIESVMTCLTVTATTVDEAIQQSADVLVTHHPLPFRALSRITNESTPGKLLLQLIESKISVYSPHTAFDSARDGINRQLADIMGLDGIQPLQPLPDESGSITSVKAESIGAGRMGALSSPMTVEACVRRLKNTLSIQHVGVVGSLTQNTHRIAVACGSAGQFLADAIRHECDMLITGETNFHTCLEAQAQGIALLLVGHFASERFAVEALAERLASDFADLKVWASQSEADPLTWV